MRVYWCVRGTCLTYVLSHDHDGVDGSELESNLADLLGRHVVGVDEHNLVVVSSGVDESLPVLLFLDSLVGFLCGCHS